MYMVEVHYCAYILQGKRLCTATNNTLDYKKRSNLGV